MDGPLDDEVLEILSSLIAFKNRADAKGWRDAFENMPVYMERVGLTEDIKKLRVVHVAGTKGKGSTCAMVESVLRGCGYRTGLYTSPHLVDVRERVRIGGRMVSKAVFEKHFWECYDKFREQATAEIGVPGYFRFITLLALKIFLDQQVDVVVLEVGIGGRLDATNIIPAPAACGITSLGFDHMEMLGDTLPKIAREKAGILKKGRPGFTVSQPDDALEALHEVANNVGAPLAVVKPLDQWQGPEGGPADVGAVAAGGAHQLVNAGMAVQLCMAFEQEALREGRAAPGAEGRLALLSQGRLPGEYSSGLAATEWPGRSQVVHDPEFIDETTGSNSSLGSSSTPAQPAVQAVQGGAYMGPRSRLSFFIDGAHTPESMGTCADWFAQAVATHAPVPSASSVERVLVFNCMKERDPGVLLPALAASLAARGVRLSHTIFVPPESQYGFLATKKHPAPPGSSGAAAVGGTGSAAAAPQLTAAAAAAQGAAAAGAAPAGPDFSWQEQLQAVWEAHCLPAGHGPKPGEEAAAAAAEGPKLPGVPGMRAMDSRRGAIAPSLRATLDWLRARARASPQGQLQVLVTGSLYLVGDVLRMLGRAPK